MKDFKDKFSDFGKKANRTAADAKDWILENKNVSVPAGIGILVLIIICVVVGMNRPKGQTASVQETQSGVQSVISVPEVPLEENAHSELNALFAGYYEAIANGDVDTVEQLRDYISDSEKIAISKRSEYIDSYQNLSCYTKPGPMEDSYVAYVYTEARMHDYETLAPGIKTFLVYRGEAGDYRILSGEIDENLDSYIKQISVQADVEELFTRVQVKYAEMGEQDPELKAFLDELKGIVDTYVAEEIAKKEGTEEVAEAEPQTEEPEIEPQTQETQEAGNTTQMVAATSVVNVRTSDSETADKLGKAQIGDRFVLLENRENGWSKIQFEGRDAFIKTEFLEVVDEQTADSTPAPAPADSAPTGETVTAKTTVNVRASANENGERLGTIYQGEKLEVIMKQADGWTKVKYEGQTAYVKSEFME